MDTIINCLSCGAELKQKHGYCKCNYCQNIWLIGTDKKLTIVSNLNEQQVTSVLKRNNNIIYEHDLRRIIGRYPNYPLEQVGEITLTKQFSTNFYRASKLK
jgi:NCAIR mutase (PurE)-related protein